ncbi:MAG TPA: cytochrome C class I protein [Betaproteobacteria bacterium]|nr:cytochrome C class I protein [Betaproteobacteria bacterium]
MKCFTAFGVIGVLIIAAALLVIYSGVVNVAATAPHAAATRWVLHTAMRASVRRHAENVKAPSLTDPLMIQTGMRHYREMCIACHGAPGVEPGEIARGLAPAPPDLAKSVRHWSAPQLFWIIKHGVNMTGMPAWGPTHSDDALWAMVAFLERLPRLSPADYQRMVNAVRDLPSVENDDHSHRQGHGH